jgi:hypothetical protein
MDRQVATVARLVGQGPADAIPRGVSPEFWRFLVPTGNDMTDARVALGRKLYFDAKLSRDGTVACATCHDTSRGFTDRRNTSEGIQDQIGQRNAPTTLNAAFFSTQFWDGRAATLEDQAKLPIVNPIEMGQPDGTRLQPQSREIRSTRGRFKPRTVAPSITTTLRAPSLPSNEPSSSSAHHSIDFWRAMSVPLATPRGRGGLCTTAGDAARRATS